MNTMRSLTGHDGGCQEPTVDELSGREDMISTVVVLPLVKRAPDSPLSETGAKKGAKKGAKTEEIKQRIEAVYSAICENPSVKNVELEEIVGASKRQIELAIKTLQEDGRNSSRGW